MDTLSNLPAWTAAPGAHPVMLNFAVIYQISQVTV
jgi:hypothetical protein